MSELGVPDGIGTWEHLGLVLRAAGKQLWPHKQLVQSVRAFSPRLTRLRHSPDPGATKDLVPHSVVELKTGSGINSLS